MKFKMIFICSIFFFTQLTFASEHGIYLMTNKSVKADLETVVSKITTSIKQSEFTLLHSSQSKVPDYVREDSTEYCGFKAHLIVLSSASYTKMLTSYHSKYLVAGFIKIGIYETPEGVNVSITDPETINRIVFNDLYENDEEKLYNEVITKTKVLKEKLIDMLHYSVDGEKVKLSMPPIRDDEDLAESSRDMFMMVGPLTLFTDEDQFPEIYSVKNTEGFQGLTKLKNELIENLSQFKPTEDDIEYRWYPNKSDLKWEIISEIKSPNNDAILLGLTRPRTEAVSFTIAGASREDEKNMCPGIDHVSAYPIEVLLIREDNNIKIYTQREMHRMDMYFWDAGMSAFMDHMSMPGILDESLKRALLGKKFLEE